MNIEVRVRLPESVADATLVAWRKQPGQLVKRDEALADLETDKVVLEVPAPASGLLAESRVCNGTVVTAGQVLAVIEAPGGSSEGAGKASEYTPALTIPNSTPVRGVDGERRVPMTRIRQRIAERLLQAQATQALVTTVNEVDVTAVQEMRARYEDRLGGALGVKLGLVPFFVKATIVALRRFPIVNAAIDGDDIVYHDYYDIGVAVSTDRGLMVPIIRDADQKSFTEIEQEIGLFTARARQGTMSLEELTGGTFTITNGGVYGSLLSTPIVSPPQSAILGMHAIQDRPMVLDGVIVIRPMMYVVVTYDHRLVDGSDAVQFLRMVKQCLEQPRRLLAGE